MTKKVLQLLAQKLEKFELVIEVGNKNLAELNLATYPDALQHVATVSPSNVEQLQAIVIAANELVSEGHSLKLYTVSTGQNWGYGSATSSFGDTVLIQLKNMGETPEWVKGRHEGSVPYGKDLGIVKISPGVTQQRLFDFLQEEGGKFWMDATGSSTSCSVLGNYITRGFGHTKAGDHADFIAGMEVVLPDGTFVKTGHGGLKGASNIGVHKHGLGPNLDGMFCQSNLGIVTAIYIQLLPAQKYTYKYFIKVKSTRGFLKAIDVLTPFKLNGSLQSQMHCGNADKAIQAIMRFPFDRVPKGVGYIPDALKKQLREENNISEWTISGAIYSNNWLSFSFKYIYFFCLFLRIGTPLILPSSLARFLKSMLSSAFISNKAITLQKKLTPTIDLLNELLDLKQGKPTDYFLEGINHKKKTDCTDNNPDKDRVGLIWLAPIAPLHRKYAELLINTTTDIMRQYQFDSPISITLLNTRALECIIAIVFDRDNKAEEKRAMECHDDLIDAFNKLGLSSYRSSLRAMQLDKMNYTPELEKFLLQLKQAIDPNALYSDGYYIPVARPESS